MDFFIKAMEAEKPEDVKMLARRFMANVRKMRPSYFKDGGSDYEHNYLMSSPFAVVSRKHGLPRDFAWECLKSDPEMLKNKKTVIVEKVIRSAISSNGGDESMKELMPYVPQLKQDVVKYMTDQGYYELLVMMSHSIWELGGRNPSGGMQPPNGGMGPSSAATRQRAVVDMRQFLTRPQEEFFKAVNGNANLKYGRYSELLKTNDNNDIIILLQACRDGENLLLLMGRIDGGPVRKKLNQYFLVSLHPDLTSESILDPVNWMDVKHEAAPGTHGPSLGPGLRLQSGCLLACNSSFIVFGYQTNLWVLDRKTKDIVSTIQVPEMRNSELAVTDERLFLLNCTNMMSMNLLGEDRQVIFDMERLDPQSKLDRKARASGLQLLSDGRLMFLAYTVQQDNSNSRERGIEQIWTCKTDGSELKSVIELPLGRKYALYDGGEGPLLSASDNYHHKNCIFYKIDVEKEQLEKIAQTPTRSYNDSRLIMLMTPFKFTNNEQFIVKNGWLLQGYYSPLIINISAPEKSPFLWLPVTYKLLSIGDHVMFFRNNCWFMMDTKEMGNEK